jgi:hypothetical protein
MSLDLSTTELTIAIAAAIAAAAYIAFIVTPAVRAYGRLWEKLAAGFLTLYIVGTLLGMGAVLGLLVVWSYDTYS